MEFDVPAHATLIIDGMALVVTIAKLQIVKTFGDLSDAFTSAVYHTGRRYRPIHIVFDRYSKTSIKHSTSKANDKQCDE